MIHLRTLTVPSIVCALLLAACNKDELIVVSTVTPSTHTCKRITVQLNIDSLTQCMSNPPGDPDLTVAVCDCDTLVLEPVNIPSDFDFEHWIIEQGTVHTYHNQLVLDTITVDSDLWLEFDHGFGDEHVRVVVNVGPC